MACGRVENCSDQPSLASAILPEVEYLSELDQFLDYNSNKKKFLWNGNVDDLGKFIEDRILSYDEDEDDAPELVVSSNSQYAVFKTPWATFNFYHSTKTLQVQGKACSEMKKRLLDIFNLRTNSFQRRQDNGDELAASPDDQNSAEVSILTDLNNNEDALESLDCDVGDDAENEGDADLYENVRRAEISKSNLHLALPDNREILSLKIEELKAELDKRGLKKSGNKATLVHRLRDAIISEQHSSQAIETDSTFNESPVNGQTSIQGTPNVQDIYSFIEIKVKDVCRLEIEKLKLEASSSYSNETIASLREENGLLNERIQELESRYESVREEAVILNGENKSLVTVIRLLGKESKVVTKEERSNTPRDAVNNDLLEKLQELESRHSMLKQEYDLLREENKSLLTATRLINNEVQNSNEGKCFSTTSQNLHDQISDGVNGVSPVHNNESSWVTVNNVKSKQSSKRKRSNKSSVSTNANTTEPSRPTVERNYTSHQKRETLNATQQTQNPSILGSDGNLTTDHTGKKKLVFIAGDSIIQHVQGWKLSTSDKHVAVKSFSGARIADMDDYLKPLLRKDPDEIILHVGTNNIRDESPRSVAEGIVNLVTQAQQDFPSTRLTISPLLPRSDNLDFNDKIKEANKILNSFCTSRGLTLLHITNIDLTCLNRRGVHLNRKGSALLSNCYADFLRSN